MSSINPLPSHDLFEVKITDIRDLTADIKQFTLQSNGGRALPPSEAGAHIALHLPKDVVRQYSLMDPDPKPQSYRIGVKLEDHSSGGSQYLFSEASVGDVVQIEAPRNNFPLIEEAEHNVLFAGGIGITPIWSMVQRLEQLRAARPQISRQLFYAARSRNHAAFLTELQKLDNVTFHFDDEQGGFFDIRAAVQAVPQNSHLYCCGPAPMLEAFEEACRGRPENHVHVEYFTAKEESATEGGFIVELVRSKMEVRVPEGKTILEALREAGVDMPSSCEEGVCGTCETRVLSGIPDHRDIILSDSEKAANNTMMICCSGSKSDRLVLDC